MKYLKRFENLEYNDAEEFLRDNLIFLLDEHFNLSRENLHNNVAIFSLIRKDKEIKIGYDEESVKISWDQVKDDFIPFLIVLKKNYKMYSFHWENSQCKKYESIELFDNEKYDITYHTLDDVINDRIECNDIRSLSIKINYGKRLE